MNSTLKPVISQASVPSGGQASPAKANLATNHNVGHPQGSNSHHQNSLVGQNLTNHPPNSAQLPHAVPSMAPISANMAQMAHNMSHHGNLSHTTPNSVPPTNTAVTPTKTATSTAPLSLVADKPVTSQPLALTRTPDKKEENGNQSNGSVESPKVAANPVVVSKSPVPEPAKDKPEIPKTPSTPKVAEKPSSTTNTPQKAEATSAVGQADVPAQAKVAVAEQEKSPAKPMEPKPVPTADVPPPQSESKPETANASQSLEKPSTPPKPTPEPAKETPVPAPVVTPAPTEKTPEESKPEKPGENKEETKPQPDSTEAPKKQESEKPVEKVEVKKDPPATPKTPAKPEFKAAKPNMKLATVTTPARKRRSSATRMDTPAAKKHVDSEPATPDSRSKRNRTQVQPYQSPTPELAMATKLSASAAGRATPPKHADDKLIVFYKNEYLAVRNAEGGFYVCQAVQNVYRTTRKIKIRWLSQDAAGDVYKPDFYDVTDMECVLTTLSLRRAGAGWALRAGEAARALSILRRALAADRGERRSLDLTEEHPDGLDLSLYKDESQLDKKGRRGRPSPKRRADSDSADAASSPSKKLRTPPKRSAARAPAPPPAATKTATPAGGKARGRPAPKPAASPKATASPKAASPKVASPKVATPKARPARRPAKEPKQSPAPTPSTSTGKATRTPRKPPAKK